MKLKKAKIYIQSVEELKREWKGALKGKVRYIQKKDTLFLSHAAASKIFSPARIALLCTIAREKPKSIYALAQRVRRDFKNVHSDVVFLADAGLIDLREHGPRDSITPVAKYSGFEVDLAA